jgi:hypothetical protein
LEAILHRASRSSEMVDTSRAACAFSHLIAHIKLPSKSCPWARGRANGTRCREESVTRKGEEITTKVMSLLLEHSHFLRWKPVKKFMPTILPESKVRRRTDACDSLEPAESDASREKSAKLSYWSQT